MRLLKEYRCDGCKPSDDEIKEGIEIAAKEHCIVRLNWFFPYSGSYRLDITEGMTFEECKGNLPKVYPV